MYSRGIPVFPVNPFPVAIQIQLIHAEGDESIFGLPLLFVRILVLHSQISHYAAASWVFSVMGGGYIGQSVFFYLVYNSLSGLRHNSSVPEFSAKSVTEIMVFFHIHFNITDGEIVFLKADGVGVPLRKQIF